MVPRGLVPTCPRVSSQAQTIAGSYAREGSREGLCSQHRGMRGGEGPGGRSFQISGLGEGQVCREKFGVLPGRKARKQVRED